MAPILFCIGFIIAIFIIYKINASYQNKVDEVLNFFNSKGKIFDK